MVNIILIKGIPAKLRNFPSGKQGITGGFFIKWLNFKVSYLLMTFINPFLLPLHAQNYAAKRLLLTIFAT